MNKLILGDNLKILKGIPNESVDLVYIDPPFFTGHLQSIIWKDKSRVSYKDTSSSHGGLDGYLKRMEAVLEALKAVLKKTGSIYVHVDTSINAYLRVAMDSIFGRKNFKSEIVWERNKIASNFSQKKAFGKVSDRILFYAKSKEYTFNTQYNEYSESTKKVFKKDKRGIYIKGRTSGRASDKNRIYDYKGYKPPPQGWMFVKKTMEQKDKEGLLIFGKSTIKYKKYHLPGVPLKDLWTDLIGGKVNNSKEGVGYPTQKPLKLLERIIKISSNEGDTVLDCFCGSGTTLHAAHNLNRKWIGIDSNPEAIKITKERLKNAEFTIFGEQSRDPKEDSQRIG